MTRSKCLLHYQEREPNESIFPILLEHIPCSVFSCTFLVSATFTFRPPFRSLSVTDVERCSRFAGTTNPNLSSMPRSHFLFPEVPNLLSLGASPPLQATRPAKVISNPVSELGPMSSGAASAVADIASTGVRAPPPTNQDDCGRKPGGRRRRRGQGE